METIFDYNPTATELKNIGIDWLSLSLTHGAKFATDEVVKENNYKSQLSQNNAYFDLALLFEERGDTNKANTYWEKIPAKHQEYLLGFDNVFILE